MTVRTSILLRHFRASPVRTVTLIVQSCFTAIPIPGHRTTRIKNVSVEDGTMTQSGAGTFVVIEGALEMIANVAPAMLLRIQRDLNRVSIRDGSVVHYEPLTGTCVLGVERITRGSLADIAACIIHEAAHARLFNVGVGMRRKDQDRIERCCVRRELAFLERIPGTEPLIRHRLSSLADPWWTPPRILEARLQSLRAAGAPHWVLTFTRWLYRGRVSR